MKREPHRWRNEAEMLGCVMQRASAAGWACYPESCGHDLVLVAPPRPAPRFRGSRDTHEGPRVGDVVAVEGKLRANVEVLYQAVPPSLGPSAHWYCCVVPDATHEFREIAHRLGIAIHCPLHPDDADGYGERRAEWDPRWDDDLRRAPADVIAPLLAVNMYPGLPSPRHVTPWKVAAVKLCLRGGELRSADFPGASGARGWLQRGWVRVLRREGRRAIYELVDAPTRPDRVYPEIAAALRSAAPG